MVSILQHQFTIFTPHPYISSSPSRLNITATTTTILPPYSSIFKLHSRLEGDLRELEVVDHQGASLLAFSHHFHHLFH
ncbi:hypothetical protein HanXRQr2_Chr08g0348101 [Helianthus annuus]|uniref:Uncharacterized protein n=1 Tax=Helianthus annuus TaxID=4232 RepID=A0A251U8V9_HELAN|nr:hypothetical protein HanXRQr2_Chr08g0348101 [Helianthus annuus]KAJ0902383.1 hypothetical protein HanPSC8_Chr08g0336361 [Helianthus annuus]